MDNCILNTKVTFLKIQVINNNKVIHLNVLVPHCKSHFIIIKEKQFQTLPQENIGETFRSDPTLLSYKLYCMANNKIHMLRVFFL